MIIKEFEKLVYLHFKHHFTDAMPYDPKKVEIYTKMIKSKIDE